MWGSVATRLCGRLMAGCIVSCVDCERGRFQGEGLCRPGVVTGERHIELWIVNGSRLVNIAEVE